MSPVVATIVAATIIGVLSLLATALVRKAGPVRLRGRPFQVWGLAFTIMCFIAFLWVRVIPHSG